MSSRQPSTICCNLERIRWPPERSMPHHQQASTIAGTYATKRTKEVVNGAAPATSFLQIAGTLQTLVDSLGAQNGKTALLALTKHGREEWSYRELCDRARAFACRLIRIGVRAGDSVVAYAENRPEWIATALGVLRAGAVLAPIDVQFSDADLAHILRDSGARAVITT